MLASSPMRATSAEFRYNFVERFDNDLPVMTKLRTRVRTLARKLKPTRVAPESTPDMPDAAAELARLRATNADLRVQLAAFRTLDVQYAARTTALASERDALLTHAAVADALRASVEDMRAGLMEARSEAHFYRRHAQELVQELGVRSVSRFSDDSSRSASSASLDELTDSDESIATEGDATLVEHPVVWEAEHDSTYDALMKMCAAKPERPLKSFLPISEDVRAPAKRASPIQMIRERTKARQARWEEIRL